MKNSLFSVKGKAALITGGGTGLGFGISKAFADAGVNIVITGRRENVLKEACEALGGKADYIVNDITELDTLPGLVQKIESEFGPIDILVNNAGVNLKKHLLHVS